MGGFLVSIGFTAGTKAGKLLVFALTVEFLSLGLAVAVTLGDSGVTCPQSLRAIALLVEAHEVVETPVIASTFFASFLLFLLTQRGHAHVVCTGNVVVLRQPHLRQ